MTLERSVTDVYDSIVSAGLEDSLDEQARSLWLDEEDEEGVYSRI